jgi:hypothetical protein
VSGVVVDSWNHFGCGITEEIVRNQTDAFVQHLAPHGYEYMNLDECVHCRRRERTASVQHQRTPYRLTCHRIRTTNAVLRSQLLDGVQPVCYGQTDGRPHEVSVRDGLAGVVRPRKESEIRTVFGTLQADVPKARGKLGLPGS